MAEWRLFRGWNEAELRERLDHLDALDRNFEEEDAEMTPVRGWRTQHSSAVVAREEPGPAVPEGPFERLRTVLRNYQFSDPRIVTAHFDPRKPFLGRRYLLELCVPALRYLCATVVSAERDERDRAEPVYGFRYETLEGHIEQGWEWFVITKGPEGEITFSIEARWKPGTFPNFWSRLGFAIVGKRMQKRWHRHAHLRMMFLSTRPIDELRRGGRIAHEGPEISFDF